MNRATRVYLLFVGGLWAALGLWCAMEPTALAELAGIGQEHWSARVEVRAMYGGVQLAVGLFTLYALVDPRRYLQPALLLNALLLSLLALLRMVGLLLDGPGLQLGASEYPEAWNASALWFFELPVALISWALFVRARLRPGPAQS